MDQVVKTKTWTTPIVERINLEFDKDMNNPCITSADPTSAGCGPDSEGTCWRSIE